MWPDISSNLCIAGWLQPLAGAEGVRSPPISGHPRLQSARYFFRTGLLFRPLGVKFVFDHHDLCPEMYLAKGRSRTGMLYRGLVSLERMTLKSADVVIAVNESHRAIAHAAWWHCR